MRQELYEKIKDIKLDRQSGASQLARKALCVLRFVAETSEKETLETFLKDFNYIGRKLFEARPSVAPIQNLVCQIVYGVSTKREGNLISFRNFVISKIDELSRNSELAAHKASEYGACMINHSDIVVTCSYSSTVCNTLKMVKRQGKNFSVLVAESWSNDGSLCYGRRLARELEFQGIPTEVFPDDAINQYASRAKKALVGADSVLDDGSIINGKPTYNIALATKEGGIPFYTVCEASKFNILSYLGKKPEIEEGFDYTPSKFITRIITEKGVIEPYKVINYMSEMEIYLKKLYP